MSGQRAAAALLGILLSAAIPAAAQNPPLPRAAQFLMPRLEPDMTLDQFMQRVGMAFRQADANGDAMVVPADDELLFAMTAASFRSAYILEIVRADSDGDGVVTADELRIFLRFDRRAQQPTDDSSLEGNFRRLMGADTDKDGRITWPEMLAFAHLRMAETQRGMSTIVPDVMLFDADRNGRVTLVELEVPAEALFRTVDADGNGVVSRDEIVAYRKLPTEPTPEVLAAARAAAEQREKKR